MEKTIFKLIIFSICLSISPLLMGQEFTPIVHTYDRSIYHSDNQNWSVSSSDEGVMYFGNGRGLLSFDGYRWQTYPLPNGKIVRSVFAKGERIYVGSHEQFGYFDKQENGELEYHSLSALLNEYKMQNDEIWRILDFKGNIIFQSFTSYFVYDGKTVSAFRTPSICLFFNICRGHIVTSCDNYGVISIDFRTGKENPIPNVPFDSQLVSILRTAEGKWLMVTYSDGLYYYDGKTFTKFRTEIDDRLPLWQPNNAVISPAGDIIIGTKLKGAVCIDSNGKEKWCINTSNVLNSNTVLGMDFDHEGDLWIALDGGIAMARIDSRLSYIRSITPSVGSVHSTFYAKPYLYIGTGQGLYRGRLDDNLKFISEITAVKEVLGHVWSIEQFGHQIFCGTNYETFEISKDKIQVISQVVGGSSIDKGEINGQEILIQGTYTYPCIYKMRAGKWQFAGALTDFMQPISSLQIDSTGTIWAGHQYKGIYAIHLSDNLDSISSSEFFPALDDKTERPVSVCKINGRTIFMDGETGYYRYDPAKRKFTAYAKLNEALGNYPSARNVRWFEDNLYWFISSSMAILVSIDNENIRVEDIVLYESLCSNVPDENQSITPIAPHKCMIALGNTLALYEYSGKGSFVKPDIPKISLSRIRMKNMESNKDSLLALGSSDPFDIPYKFNNLDIEWLVPHFSPDGALRFRFRLDSGDWSSYTSEPSVSYPYLKKGRHLIAIQASRHPDEVVSESSLIVNVKTPFYLSVYAIILYAIAATGLFVFIGYTIRRTKKEKAMEEIKSELESEVRLKSKELAASTLNVIHKNELLGQIRKAIDEGRIDKAVSIIDRSGSGNKDWKIYEDNFDNIHANFFRNLRERYPSLTDNDLRVCAYLRLNLSSKDIAELMNISLKGVEAARARIRKKIGLSSHQSLTTFMIDLK